MFDNTPYLSIFDDNRKIKGPSKYNYPLYYLAYCNGVQSLKEKANLLNDKDSIWYYLDFLFENPYQSFHIHNNNFYCVLTNTKFRYDASEKQLYPNQNHELTKMLEPIFGSIFMDSECYTQIFEILNNIARLLNLEDKKSYPHICKQFTVTTHISQNEYLLLTEPTTCFKLQNDVLYYCFPNPTDSFKFKTVTPHLLETVFKAKDIKSNFGLATSFYNALYDELLSKTYESVAESPDPFILIYNPFSPTYDLKYSCELGSFNFAYSSLNTFPVYPPCKGSIGKSLLPGTTKFLKRLTCANVKTLYLISEFIARILSNKHSSGFLWVFTGDLKALRNFCVFLNNCLIASPLLYDSIDKLCQASFLESILNCQINNSFLYFSIDCDSSLNRLKPRFRSILRGEAVKGPKMTLWDKEYKVNSVFAYGATPQKLNQLKENLSSVPMRIIKIGKLSQVPIGFHELTQVIDILKFLGLKNIVENSRCSSISQGASVDTINEFFNNCCLRDKSASPIDSQELYNAYKSYCELNGLTPIGKYKLMSQLSSRYKLKYEQLRSNNNRKVMYGITLNTFPPPSSESCVKAETFEEQLNEIFNDITTHIDIGKLSI